MKSLIWIILVITPGVWSGNWRVTYKNQCALKGTSVVITCKYDYPAYHTVLLVKWYKYSDNKWTALSNLSSTGVHFKYVGNKLNDCSLQINNVQRIDEGAYLFYFKTNYNQWTSKTYATLAVKELTTDIQPSTVTEGGNVRLTCVADCPTPVNIVWFRDEQAIRNPPFFQARREDAGRYHCAMLGQETIRSKSVALNVQYYPVNISISMNPLHIVGGSSVNLTCSSTANPPANYTWYKRTDSLSSTVQVGSGQVLSIHSVEAPHTGLYLCQARNQLGGNNSTELLLAMMEGWKEENGIQFLPIIAGIGVFLFVALVVAFLLFWRKGRAHAERRQPHIGLSGRGSSSLGPEDQPNTVYANIHALPTFPPAVTDISPNSQKSSHPEYDAPTAHEDEVTYSTVTITPKKPSRSHHINNSKALQDSQSKLGENVESVIYATVVKSS